MDAIPYADSETCEYVETMNEKAVIQNNMYIYIYIKNWVNAKYE